VVEATRAHTPGFVHIDPAAHEIVRLQPRSHGRPFDRSGTPNFKGYFVVKFNAGFRSHGVYLGADLHRGMGTAQGPNAGGYVTFETSKTRSSRRRSDVLYQYRGRRRRNLQLEVPSWNFESVRAQLKQTWNQKLAAASIEGASEDQRGIFYTALYHALLYPKLFSEHGRYYSAFDDKVHRGVSYTAYSLWDTFSRGKQPTDPARPGTHRRDGAGPVTGLPGGRLDA